MRRARVAAATLAGAVLAGAPAHAATLGVEGTTVTLRVATGEPVPTVRYANHGPAFAQPPEYTASTVPPQPMTAAPGCRQHNPSHVICDDNGGINAFAAYLGDGNDRLELGATVLSQPAPFPVLATMSGGGGNDTLIGVTAHRNVLDGGPGEDTLRGGDVADELRVGPDGGIAEGWNGDDVLYAGDGEINRVVGGSGNDRSFSGASGAGHYGDSGDDVLTGGPAADIMEGGPDDDVLEGAGGDDHLVGGPGRDRIAGGDGRDFIDALDGQADTISCGAGVDRVRKDRFDKLPRDCEVRPRLRWKAFRVDGMTVSFTLHRFSERVTGRVTAHRCLEQLGAQLTCRKGEEPGRFGSRRFEGRPGSQVKIRITLDRDDVRTKLRQPGRKANERDVWLLVRFEDRDGLKGQRGTRMLLKL